MEGIILLGLAGAGYIMNKNKEEEQSRSIETNVRPQVNQGSNSSIYDINNYLDSKNMNNHCYKLILNKH